MKCERLCAAIPQQTNMIHIKRKYLVEQFEAGRGEFKAYKSLHRTVMKPDECDST